MRIDLEADIRQTHWQIAQRMGLDKSVFYLTSMGHYLEDGKTAREYGISRDATIHMSVRLDVQDPLSVCDAARARMRQQGSQFQ